MSVFWSVVSAAFCAAGPVTTTSSELNCPGFAVCVVAGGLLRMAFIAMSTVAPGTSAARALGSRYGLATAASANFCPVTTSSSIVLSPWPFMSSAGSPRRTSLPELPEMMSGARAPTPAPPAEASAPTPALRAGAVMSRACIQLPPPPPSPPATLAAAPPTVDPKVLPAAFVIVAVPRPPLPPTAAPKSVAAAAPGEIPPGSGLKNLPTAGPTTPAPRPLMAELIKMSLSGSPRTTPSPAVPVAAPRPAPNAVAAPEAVVRPPIPMAAPTPGSRTAPSMATAMGSNLLNRLGFFGSYRSAAWVV